MVLLIIGVLFLAACSKDSIDYFPSKEAALDAFVQSEEINGTIEQVTTMTEEELLVVQKDENRYFVGELLEDKKGFVANRISDNVIMELGGSWELTTSAKHKYTIYFEKEPEDQYYRLLTNEEYYISIIDGHHIQKDNSTFTDAIQDMKVLKE